MRAADAVLLLLLLLPLLASAAPTSSLGSAVGAVPNEMAKAVPMNPSAARDEPNMADLSKVAKPYKPVGVAAGDLSTLAPVLGETMTGAPSADVPAEVLEPKAATATTTPATNVAGEAVAAAEGGEISSGHGPALASTTDASMPAEANPSVQAPREPAAVKMVAPSPTTGQAVSTATATAPLASDTKQQPAQPQPQPAPAPAQPATADTKPPPAGLSAPAALEDPKAEAVPVGASGAVDMPKATSALKLTDPAGTSAAAAGVKVPGEIRTTAKPPTRPAAGEEDAKATRPLEKDMAVDAASLKIYVYPNLPHGETLFDSVELYQENNVFNTGAFQRAERSLHRLMLSDPSLLVSSPAEANVLYVPVYAYHKCKGAHMGTSDSLCFLDTYEETVQVLKDRGTWNNGYRHFIPALFDTSMCGFNCYASYHDIIGLRESWEEMSRLGTCFDVCSPKPERARDFLKWPTAIVGEAHAMSFLGLAPGSQKYGECYHETDVVIPAPTNFLDSASLNMLQSTVAAGMGRKNKVYFRGGLSGNPLRKELVELYSKHPMYLVTTEEQSQSVITREFADSTFCVTPPGHAPWSFRLTEAILAGCIPVIIDADKQILPFQRNGLQWDEFAVLLNSNELPQLDERVNKAQLRVTEMRAALSKAAKAIRFDGPEAHAYLMLEMARAMQSKSPAARGP